MEEELDQIKVEFIKTLWMANTSRNIGSILNDFENYIVKKAFKRIESGLNFNLMEEGNCYEDGYNEGIQAQSNETQRIINNHV